MRRILTNPLPTFLFALCALAPGNVASAERATEVAMITDVVGACAVTSGGRKTPCDLFRNLVAGDEIELADRGKLVLTYFAPAREFTIAGPTTATVGTKEPQASGNNKVRARSLTGAVNDEALRDWSRKHEVLGGVIMRGGVQHKIRLLSPVGTVLERPASFAWDATSIANKGRAQFRLVLSDQHGKLILETLVDDARLQLPPELKLQAGEQYSWEVSTRLADRESYSSIGSFAIADNDVRRTVEAGRPGRGASFTERLLFAMTLEAFGFRQLAREQWAELARERPDLAHLGKLAKQTE